MEISPSPMKGGREISITKHSTGTKIIHGSHTEKLIMVFFFDIAYCKV